MPNIILRFLHTSERPYAYLQASSDVWSVNLAVHLLVQTLMLSASGKVALLLFSISRSSAIQGSSPLLLWAALAIPFGLLGFLAFKKMENAHGRLFLRAVSVWVIFRRLLRFKLSAWRNASHTSS